MRSAGEVRSRIRFERASERAVLNPKNGHQLLLRNSLVKTVHRDLQDLDGVSWSTSSLRTRMRKKLKEYELGRRADLLGIEKSRSISFEHTAMRIWVKRSEKVSNLLLWKQRMKRRYLQWARMRMRVPRQSAQQPEHLKHLKHLKHH